MVSGCTGSSAALQMLPMSSCAPLRPVLRFSQLAPQSVDLKMPFLDVVTYSVPELFGSVSTTSAPAYGASFTMPGGEMSSHSPTLPRPSHLPTTCGGGTSVLGPVPAVDEEPLELALPPALLDLLPAVELTPPEPLPPVDEVPPIDEVAPAASCERAASFPPQAQSPTPTARKINRTLTPSSNIALQRARRSTRVPPLARRRAEHSEGTPRVIGCHTTKGRNAVSSHGAGSDGRRLL